MKEEIAQAQAVSISLSQLLFIVSNRVFFLHFFKTTSQSSNTKTRKYL